MSSGEDSEFVLDEARQHHLTRVNGVLRRPGMYGRDEMAERLLLDAMAAVDGSLKRLSAEWDGLRDRDAFTATGVMGAYSNILPADALRDATASVYAEIAHRLGWLELDRALSEAEFQQLSSDVGEWVTQDRMLPEVIETFGPSSLWIGGTNPFYAKTLAYTTADPDHALICFHLWNAFANIPAGTGLRGVHPEPVVLAVRHRPGSFPDSFSFTPEGLRRRPTADQSSPLRSTVWIFHGDRARYASGVFDTLDAGLAWAAEHHVTGILAEYANGGAYDAAVSEGRFTPSKTHHGTADHVAAFGPGLRHIHLTEGRRD
ncbi:hypothetical protein ONA91_32725 [Micromonospora sp. DR5-3]|uniref:DUF7710 domain-containing protein n=1 Tax=unclassified Micromonospora TaxID=2617518 RepID=UPI0011DA7F42|nr:MULTISPECIES: hypothetical protein [unclassified Micromonospora]MCW3819217.1 hypothetical protein [Micromonospora sp. DR5-3]TYC20747.1 hypothetical protein FXF52_29750 [Micromonospora sp. MP36]